MPVHPFIPYFFFNAPPPTDIYTLSLHDALPISMRFMALPPAWRAADSPAARSRTRSEEHTSELQSHSDLVCRLLLEKKKKSETGLKTDSERNVRPTATARARSRYTTVRSTTGSN